MIEIAYPEGCYEGLGPKRTERLCECHARVRGWQNSNHRGFSFRPDVPGTCDVCTSPGYASERAAMRELAEEMHP